MGGIVEADFRVCDQLSSVFLNLKSLLIRPICKTMKTSSLIFFRIPTRWITVFVLVMGLFNSLQAQDSDDSSEKTSPSDTLSSREDLEKKFQVTMSHVEFIGRWCSVKDGLLGEEKQEKYSIVGATKMAGDLWIINARIQFGNKDVTIPVPVRLKWAGDTPVISITELGLPGLGSYTARVVVYDGMYAGTWSAPDHGGLLNGVIRKIKEKKAK